MTLRIGINGLGRIGRCLLRALTKKREGHRAGRGQRPRAIPTHLHLLGYDSVHGRFPGELVADGDHLRAGSQLFPHHA